jgi:hypothetical protein
MEGLERRQLLSTSPAHLVIVPTFDPSITTDPQAATIEATIDTAIDQYETTYATPITVRIYFEEGPGLGGSDTPHFIVSYFDYLKAFAAHVTTADQRSALASLPQGAINPLTGGRDIDLTQANARALGFRTHTGSDGVVTLTTSEMNLTRQETDPNKYSLQDVAEHEIDEVLGIGSDLDGLNNGDPVPTGAAVTDEDLFRYSKGHGRSYTTASDADSYFSDDGGKTDLARFNQDEEGDMGDWFSISGDEVPQVQDAFGTPGVYVKLNVELTVLDVLGWERITKPRLQIGYEQIRLLPLPGDLLALAHMLHIGRSGLGPFWAIS